MRAVLGIEFRKLLRQRALLFWGFVALPLATLGLQALQTAMAIRHQGTSLGVDEDLLLAAAKSAALSVNPLAHLLFAVGVAGIFCVDYRYGTWRLLVPRCPRPRLFMAKFLLCWGLLGLGLVVRMVGHIAIDASEALAVSARQSALSWSFTGLWSLVLAMLIALLELGVLTAIVATMTTLTRSMMGAVVTALLLSLAYVALILYLGPQDLLLFLPPLAADAIRAWFLSDGSGLEALTGTGILIIELIVISAAGLVTFLRQDLAE